MLNAVANLTEMKLNLTRELNTNKGKISDPYSKHFCIYLFSSIFIILSSKTYFNTIFQILVKSNKVYFLQLKFHD